MFTVLPLLDRQLSPLAGCHVRSVEIERLASTEGCTLLGARGLLLPLPLLRLMLLLLGGQSLKTVHPPLAPGLLLLLVSCLLHPTPFPHPNHGGGGGVKSWCSRRGRGGGEVLTRGK